MAELIIGTEDCVFALPTAGGDARREEGPDSALHLSAAGERLYGFTRGGALWQRTRAGQWQLVNEKPVEEEVWSFSADPWVGGLLYLGVSPAMLYRSENYGRTWESCDSIKAIPGYEQWTFPPPPHIPHVRYIAPDPDVKGAVYIGVEEGGVFYSSDGGESWDSLNDGIYDDIHTVVPTGSGQRLYATAGDGFYRSDDGGEHWRHNMTGLERSYTIPCIALPDRVDLVFTAAAATPPPGWRQKGTADAALYRSTNGGEQWDRVTKGLPDPFQAMVRALAVDGGNGTIYAGAGDTLYASQDEGESWSVAASGLSNIRSLVVV